MTELPGIVAALREMGACNDCRFAVPPRTLSRHYDRLIAINHLFEEMTDSEILELVDGDQEHQRAWAARSADHAAAHEFLDEVFEHGVLDT